MISLDLNSSLFFYQKRRSTYMTAYYNQEYHEPVDPDPVPQSNWKQILKETFLRPFT